MQASFEKIGLALCLCLVGITGCQSPRGAGRSPAPSSEERSEALARYGQGLLDDMNGNSASALSNFMAAARLDPANEELHFRVAMGLLRERRFTEARTFMEQFTARNPRSAKGFLWLALIYRAADLPQKALDTYARAARLDPASPVAYLEMANVLVKLERATDALAILSQGIRKVPDPADLVKYQSDLLVQRLAAGVAGEGERALLSGLALELEKAEAAHPEDPSLPHRRGDVAILQQDPERALESFARVEALMPDDLRVKQKLAFSFLALGDREKAIAALEAASLGTGATPRVHYYLGELYEQAGRKTDALAQFQKAAEIQPPEAAPFIKQAAVLLSDDPQAAADALARGRQALPQDARLLEMSAYLNMNRKEYRAAASDFDAARRILDEKKAESLSPSFPLHHLVAHQMIEDFAGAARILKNAMDMNPAYLDAYLQFLQRSPDADQRAGGILVLKSAADLAPEDAQIPYALALAASYAKQYPDAITAFAEAERLAKKSADEELLSSRFYFWWGAAHERHAEYDRAEERFRTSIALDPANAEAYNYLAYMWAERGTNLAEALELSLKSLELEPESAAFIDTLGWIYFMKGDYRKALKELTRAANLMPEDPTIVEHMGDVMDKSGKPDRALAYWKRSFTLDPENAKLGEKLKNLGVDVDALRAEAAARDAAPAPRVRRLGETSDTPEPPRLDPAWELPNWIPAD